MKKFYAFILAFILSLGLSACSAKTNDPQLDLEFFNAVHRTFQADSIHVNGSLDMDNDNQPSSIFIDLYLKQEDELGVAIMTTLEADGKKQPNYLDFYIKDGKTYLNSLGTKTQSTVNLIGLQADSKVDQMDPFLGLTDEDKDELLENGKKEGDRYTFDLNKYYISSLLDSYNSVDVSKASLKATIKDNIIQDLEMDISGTQTIDDEMIDASFILKIKTSDYDSLESIPYPDDLSSYIKD